jgi:hypothetical protein
MRSSLGEMNMAADIRLGTSAFTAEGWEGSFYPKGMKQADYGVGKREKMIE